MKTKLACICTISVCGFLIVGCYVSSSIHDGRTLAPKEGLLVMQVTANAPGAIYFDTFSARPSIDFQIHQTVLGSEGQISLQKAGDSTWVLPVAQGDYTWSLFNADLPSGSWRYLTDGSNHFRIKAGAINYVGHLYIDAQPTRLDVHVTNDSPAMKEFLAASYPEYSGSMALETMLTEGSVTPPGGLPARH
jgi:hypothetical protein